MHLVDDTSQACTGSTLDWSTTLKVLLKYFSKHPLATRKSNPPSNPTHLQQEALENEQE